MRLASLAIILTLCYPVAATAVEERLPTLGLMPVPANIELGNAVFEIGEGFAVSIDGDGATPRLQNGVQRMLRRLSDRSTLFFDKDVFLNFEDRENASMAVTAGRKGELAVGDDESYRLTVTAAEIQLQAAKRPFCSCSLSMNGA
jgi:hypothetical protein